MFRRVVAAAALAGLLSGLLLTALQQIGIAPLLRAAEAREQVAPTSHHAAQGSPPHGGIERIVATGLSNVILAIGFALLLAAAMSWHGKRGWPTGLLWGLAGFAVFCVAPSLGMPPALPGMESSPLRERTLWWIGTVIASATGLWMVVLARTPWIRVIGVAVLGAPHVIGAPAPTMHAGIDSAAAAREFVHATGIVNAGFWAVLGSLVGAMYRTDAPR